MVKIGIIGTGLIACYHATQIKNCGADCKITAVCDIDEEKMNRFVSDLELGDVKKYTDYRQLIEESGIDLASVCTSNDAHKEIAMAVANKKINLLCEKPLGLDAKEVSDMGKACDEAGIINMTGFTYRRIPAMAKIKKLIDDGTLGKIYHYRARFYADRLANPSHEIEWRHLEEKAGSGVLGDLASHTLDMALYLLDSQCKKLKDVYADGAIIIPERKDKDGKLCKVTTDETCTVIGHFENGCEMVLENSRYSPFDVEIHISGEKGSIKYSLLDYDAYELQLYESPADYFHTYRRVEVEPENVNGKALPTDRMARQYLYLTQCIQKGEMAHPTITETIYIQELLDVMKKSYKEQKKLSL